MKRENQVFKGELKDMEKKKKKEKEIKIKKVHCSDCKFSTFSLQYMASQCMEGFKEWKERKGIIVKPGSFYDLNIDKDCHYYKRKWWKIWVGK